MAIPVDGTTEDRASRRSGDPGLCEDEFAWRMAWMNRDRDFLDGQRRRVVAAIDADDQERYQLAQMRGLNAQQGQHSQNAKGGTSLVEQLATVMGAAVGFLKARKHQKGLRRQRLQIRHGHALDRAEHPEGNLGGIKHPNPAGVAAVPFSLFRVEVIDVLRRPPQPPHDLQHHARQHATGLDMPVTERLDLFRKLAEPSGGRPIRKLLGHGAHELSTLAGLQSCKRVPIQSPNRAIDKLVPTTTHRFGV